MSSLRSSIAPLVVALALGCAQTPPSVDAADSDAKPKSEAAKAKSDGERLICRNERPTGSHLSKRVCRTAAQIEEEREEAKRSIQRGVKGTPGAAAPGMP